VAVKVYLLVALLCNPTIGKQQMNTYSNNFSETTSRTRIAFVQSCWHRDIVDQLRDSFLRTHAELDNRDVDLFEVPGAFEIPLRTKILASSGQYAGIVTGGLIVDGGIYRHEFVSSAVIDGLMRVQLDTGVPVFSAVLTPQDFLSDGQPEFFREHFVAKGAEAAHACIETIGALKQHQVA
jgi:6,7-dimethyl-8-ribityllumazine synthase